MQKQNNETTKYPLATAGKRILARVIDIAIISCIVVALGFTIFCTDKNFEWNEDLHLNQKWRFGLFVSLMAIVFFGLMLILPRFWNKTIGMKAMKLAYYKKKEGMNYMFGLFKHELFIWEIVVIIALAMGWTLSFLNQNEIDSIFEGSVAIFASSVPEGLDKACYYVGTGFSCFYSVSILFLIAIIVATCIRSGRPTFHDKYSNIYMISLNPLSTYKPVNRKKATDEEISAPGAISKQSLEEIENL